MRSCGDGAKGYDFRRLFLCNKTKIDKKITYQWVVELDLVLGYKQEKKEGVSILYVQRPKGFIALCALSEICKWEVFGNKIVCSGERWLTKEALDVLDFALCTHSNLAVLALMCVKWSGVVIEKEYWYNIFEGYTRPNQSVALVEREQACLAKQVAYGDCSIKNASAVCGNQALFGGFLATKPFSKMDGVFVSNVAQDDYCPENILVKLSDLVIDFSKDKVTCNKNNGVVTFVCNKAGLQVVQEICVVDLQKICSVQVLSTDKTMDNKVARVDFVFDLFYDYDLNGHAYIAKCTRGALQVFQNGQLFVRASSSNTVAFQNLDKHKPQVIMKAFAMVGQRQKIYFCMEFAKQNTPQNPPCLTSQEMGESALTESGRALQRAKDWEGIFDKASQSHRKERVMVTIGNKKFDRAFEGLIETCLSKSCAVLIEQEQQTLDLLYHCFCLV
ncbi:MAG: hypothetical protein FWD76_06105, partial [Firmicutes bacterium]|nr:hypothetical protein [Bacillota bacterium]